MDLGFKSDPPICDGEAPISVSYIWYRDRKALALGQELPSNKVSNAKSPAFWRGTDTRHNFLRARHCISR
jgi:hypothetical protein